MIIRRMILPLAAIVALGTNQALAQGAFPAPLPGQTPSASIGTRQAEFPSSSAAPIEGFSAPGPGGFPSDACMLQFLRLRKEAEKRGKMIKAASDRQASPDDACKLIGDYRQAELKMIEYVQSHAASCGIPPHIGEQLKSAHENTDALHKKVCKVAQQMPRSIPAGPTGDFPPYYGSQ
jgi:hypothetical protein